MGPGLPASPGDDGPAMRVIQVRGLTRAYGDVQAVRGIDLDVFAGEIFGLIGPDGAGKTSTFHVLSGIMDASGGDVEVLGRSPRQSRHEVGYLTQAFSLYLDLSVWENLVYIGRMRGLGDTDIELRGRRYLSLFDMDRFRMRLAGRLSGGMKQKLALACALVAEPRLLLLDEPTTGVDPVSRREFWDTLTHLSDSGVTVVVATPYLDEAERCGRVAFMHEGRIRKCGTPRGLRASMGLRRLEVRTADLRRAEHVLGGIDSLEDVQRFGDRLDVMVGDAADGEAAVKQALGASTEVLVSEPTLENVFVATLRGLAEETVDAVDSLPPAAFSFPALPGGSGGAIWAECLSKQFGAFEAVRGVDLEVRPGEIYGLLGANGAGKTTVIKMLCGLLDPTSGHVGLAGARDAAVRDSAVRQRVGYMSQRFSLYDDLTIAENLEFFGGVYGLDAASARMKAGWVLEFSGLTGREGLMTGSLPGGWKQRVAFGAAIMHEPAVLFLDEPTSGVDPVARRHFWRIINQLADRGTAILVTTHYLEEAEQCNRLGMMVAGALVAQGTPSALKAAQPGHLVSLVTDVPQRACEVLRADRERWRVSLFGDRLHVIDDESPDLLIRRVSEQLERAGISVLCASRESLSLEDVFIAIVERSNLDGRRVEDA